MAYSTIDKGNKYFNTVLFSGNSGTQSITGVGFQPDLVWLKCRNSAGTWNNLIDSVRGASKTLYSNTTNSEGTDNYLSSFNSNGFSLNTGDSGTNTSGNTYVSWNWLAANSTTSNTNGTITSTVSANTTSGFSIVSYTGTGSVATVGHGLGIAPKMIIVKNRDQGAGGWNWKVYHASLGNTKDISLNRTDAATTTTNFWNNTSPTSSVFTIGTDGVVNTNGNKFIAYCFAEIKGYSKFGSYTGNNSLNNFVYTGFKPAYVMVKITSTTEQWCIKDNKRNTINPLDRNLFANAANAEDYNTTNHLIDFVSNGFVLKDNTSQNLTNGNGQSYIYMAFADSPFVSSKAIPTTAR